MLSGGVDSSLIAAIAQSESGQKINTFSIGFTEAEFDEAKFAGKTAKYIGTKHHELYVNSNDICNTFENLYEAYDEPFGDSSSIPSIILSKFVSSSIKTCLSGDGGDELFLGYNWFFAVERLRKLHQIPVWLRKQVYQTFLSGKYNGTILEGLKETKFVNAMHHMQVFSRPDREKLTGLPFGLHRLDLERAFDRDPISRNDLGQMLSELGFSTWLPNDFLVKVDRASMSQGVEVRLPFLDNTLFDFTQTISASGKGFLDDTKILPRKLLEKYFPLGFFDRTKKGFSIPLNSILRNELRTFTLDNLGSVKKFGILDEQITQNELNAFYKGSEQPNPLRLWLLLNFQLWCEKYMV